jgi:hypothetical protein
MRGFEYLRTGRLPSAKQEFGEALSVNPAYRFVITLFKRAGDKIRIIRDEWQEKTQGDKGSVANHNKERKIAYEEVTEYDSRGHAKKIVTNFMSGGQKISISDRAKASREERHKRMEEMHNRKSYETRVSNEYTNTVNSQYNDNQESANASNTIGKVYEASGGYQLVDKNNDIYLETLDGSKSKRMTHTPNMKKDYVAFTDDFNYIVYEELPSHEFYIVAIDKDDGSRK